MLKRQIIEIPDIAAADTPEFTRKAGAAGEFRSTTFVPLVHQDTFSIGTIILSHPEAGFRLSEKQLALVRTFADQAVIAIENARLFNETQEALQSQTATADILKVIARSPSDVKPVFDQILNSIKHLIESDERVIILAGDDGMIRVGAAHSPREEDLYKMFPRPLEGSAAEVVIRERRLLAFADVVDDPAAPASLKAIAPRSGARSFMMAPLMSENRAIGAITITRRSVDAFNEKECSLLNTFADQAVIAIENARLLGELRQRTADLARSVDELTATGDVLKTISRSSLDLETVLDTLVETVARLCRADQAFMFRRRDDSYYMVAASRGVSDEVKEFFSTHPVTDDRGTISGRVAAEHRPVHIPDVLQDPEYTYREGQKIMGYRTMLGIPLLREQTLIGIISINRTRVGITRVRCVRRPR
jgi:two-component system, NtrC family, sensor kinase